MPRYKRGVIKEGLLTGLTPAHGNFVIEYCKDFSPRRAAEASGFAPDTGYQLIDREDIQQAVQAILLQRLEATDIDAEWVLMEAVDNALIAKQQGNISASNTALTLVAKHVMVDAFAADKVNVNSTGEVMERLRRARDRLNGTDEDADQPSFM